MKRLDLASRHNSDAGIGGGPGISGRISFRDDRAADRDESGAPVTSAINRSLLASTAHQASATGILVTETRPRRRRTQNLTFRESHDVIGEGGEVMSSDDDATDGDDDAAELAEPADVRTAEERAFETLTRRNTDFNSISSNLAGTSRTLVDWVDENDKTTERSALTGRHKKFTPMISVAPFSTGRGPGPVKVNLVAPMQNGELVNPSQRIQKEMVEKNRTTIIKESAPTDHKVTRLDDKVTRLDDKVTRLDESPTSSGDEEAGDTAKDRDTSLKDNLIESRTDESRKGAEETSSAEVVGSVNHSEQLLSDDGTSHPPLKRSGVQRDWIVKPSIPEACLSVNRSEGISNISAIKSILAEKAAGHKSGVQKRSHAQLQERNRARLNSLDGVYRRSKVKSPAKENVTGLTSDVAGVSPVARSEPGVNAAPAVEDSNKDGGIDAADVVSDNSGNSIPETKPRQLCANTNSQCFNASGGDISNNAVSEADPVKPPKPPLPTEKPRLVPKSAKAAGSSRPANEDNGDRGLSLETSLAGRSAAAPERPDNACDAVKKSRDPNSDNPLVRTRMEPAVTQSKSNIELERTSLRVTQSIGEEILHRSDSYDVTKSKPSSCSQKSSLVNKEVETKQQRAMKREQELERKREELERRNREEKRAQERGTPGQLDKQSPSPNQTSKVHQRRDAPQPAGRSPPSPHTGVSNYHNQLKSDLRSRGARGVTAGGQPRTRAVHPALQRAQELSRPAAGGSARSSTSTDSTDEDDDDDVPAAPQRTMSVSPRSRKRGSQAAVSFAAGTESASRGGGAKPRSQSVPRPGLLNASVMNDGEVRRRLAGEVSEERRSRRDEPRSRARFSLKKLLKFGRDDKRRDKDLVFGEFRVKPEIIHPIDRAGVGRVEVVSRTAEQRRRDAGDQRRRPQRRGDPNGADSPPTGQGTQQQQQPAAVVAARPADKDKSPGIPTGHAAQRLSTGLTPEGRPKPPPPPPPTPSSRQTTGDGSRPAQTTPTRPPPPTTRSRDGWGRGQPDTDYANLGVGRADLAPKKPQRHREPPADASAAAGGDVTAQLTQSDLGVDPWRSQASRLSLRKPAAAAVPDQLQDSYDAVTASNLHALRQILNQVTQLPPGSERQMALRATAPLALAQFQMSPQLRAAVGRHVLLGAEHQSAGAVVLLVTSGESLPAPPLTVPAVAQFRDTVPTSLITGDWADAGQTEATVHVLGACRAETLGSLLSSTPAVSSEDEERAGWLLLLQAVWQLRAGRARGLPAVDESLQQLVALSSDEDPHCRLVALATDCDSAAPPLSTCQAALYVLLRLLGVPEAAARARDGRAVSSVPDLPSSIRWELLASLLQRDDDASLRRAQRVLELSLWAPAEICDEEAAARWLHRERAALLGTVVRTRPRTIAEQLQLAFLVTADGDSLADAAQLVSI